MFSIFLAWASSIVGLEWCLVLLSNFGIAPDFVSKTMRLGRNSFSGGLKEEGHCQSYHLSGELVAKCLSTSDVLEFIPLWWLFLSLGLYLMKLRKIFVFLLFQNLFFVKIHDRYSKR